MESIPSDLKDLDLNPIPIRKKINRSILVWLILLTLLSLILSAYFWNKNKNHTHFLYPSVLDSHEEIKLNMNYILGILGGASHRAIQNFFSIDDTKKSFTFLIYLLATIVIIYAVYLGYSEAKTDSEAHSLLGAYFSLLFLHVVIAAIATDSIWILFIHLIIIIWFLCAIYHCSIQAGNIALFTWILAFSLIFLISL